MNIYIAHRPPYGNTVENIDPWFTHSSLNSSIHSIHEKGTRRFAIGPHPAEFHGATKTAVLLATMCTPYMMFPVPGALDLCQNHASVRLLIFAVQKYWMRRVWRGFAGVVQWSWSSLHGDVRDCGNGMDLGEYFVFLEETRLSLKISMLYYRYAWSSNARALCAVKMMVTWRVNLQPLWESPLPGM